MRARRAAAAALALGLGLGSAGCLSPGPPDPVAGKCVDEARPDGSCLPPSQATIRDWLELGVSPEAIQDCLRRHPDGDQALALCVLRYVGPRTP